jgi:hypothetical protein
VADKCERTFFPASRDDPSDVFDLEHNHHNIIFIDIIVVSARWLQQVPKRRDL